MSLHIYLSIIYFYWLPNFNRIYEGLSLSKGPTNQHSLPSDTFKYVTWHELEEHDVQGSQICCPRVRKGPSEEECFFRGEEYGRCARKKMTEKERWEQWLQEDWENCVSLNLSYQDLGDPYQIDNSKRIICRLIRVERLWLVDNSLTDLSAICLPRCKELKLSKNHFTSFRQLPKMPEIQHLSLDENNITALNELSALRYAPLESLILKRNPCEFQENYRHNGSKKKTKKTPHHLLE
uniref:Uncharacterized protein n=1 Tax=Pseudonaja textilis TaxID=8673 RepID=A0A670ZDY6_PSETE